MPLTLEEKLKNLPTAPGVYLHKDAGGKIIYVGKAKNLRNRVRSYFQSGRGHDRMKELAEAGGGLFYEVEKLEDLAGAYERVVADLGTVYSISYRPTNKRRDGSWRAIHIRLPRHPDAVARGRRGYFAKP